ncbi:hypothetical protein NC651_039884 [Populus alba x Populus x berolinensis]|nr:hypothetical protein NC651_039884 [Populus alba x Populus x berolinensis]
MYANFKRSLFSIFRCERNNVNTLIEYYRGLP